MNSRKEASILSGGKESDPLQETEPLGAMAVHVGSNTCSQALPRGTASMRPGATSLVVISNYFKRHLARYGSGMLAFLLEHPVFSPAGCFPSSIATAFSCAGSVTPSDAARRIRCAIFALVAGVRLLISIWSTAESRTIGPKILAAICPKMDKAVTFLLKVVLK